MKYYLILKRSLAKREHAKNLAKGRLAVEQCESVVQTVIRQQKTVDTLQSLAEQALTKGNRDLALQVLREKARRQMELNRMSASLQRALDGLRTLMACLEYDAAFLGVSRLWNQMGPERKSYTYTPWEVVDLGRVQIAFRKGIPDRSPIASRRLGMRIQPSSPEEIVRQRIAQHAKNLEMGLQAVSQTDNLMQMVRDQEKMVATLTAKAELARKRGETTLADDLLREGASYENALAMTRTNFQQALETLDAIMAALERTDTVLAPSRNEEGLTVSVLTLKSEDSKPRFVIY